MQTLQALQDPILLTHWVCFRGGGFSHPNPDCGEGGFAVWRRWQRRWPIRWPSHTRTARPTAHGAFPTLLLTIPTPHPVAVFTAALAHPTAAAGGSSARSPLSLSLSRSAAQHAYACPPAQDGGVTLVPARRRCSAPTRSTRLPPLGDTLTRGVCWRVCVPQRRARPHGGARRELRVPARLRALREAVGGARALADAQHARGGARQGPDWISRTLLEPRLSLIEFQGPYWNPD
jgi:hypothetical protein